MFRSSSRLQYYYKTFYQLLQVPQNASQAQIKSSYHRIVKLYHPDTNTQESKNQEYFKQVTAAYQILSNISERQRYDEALNNNGHTSYNSYNSQNSSNYQNQSQKKKDNSMNYFTFAFIVVMTWWTERKKIDHPINLIPNKYNPNNNITKQTKQLSEEDCKDLPLEIIKEKSKKGDHIMGQLCYDRLFQDERKQHIMLKNLNGNQLQQE